MRSSNSSIFLVMGISDGIIFRTMKTRQRLPSTITRSTHIYFICTVALYFLDCVVSLRHCFIHGFNNFIPTHIRSKHMDSLTFLMTRGFHSIRFPRKLAFAFVVQCKIKDIYYNCNLVFISLKHKQP